MKLNPILILALSIALSSCNSGGGSSAKGDEGPSGGDVVLQSAQAFVESAVNKVQAMPQVFPEVNLNELVRISKTVKLIGREKTFANGVETDAANDGRTTIYLNLSRWSKRTNTERKTALVFHELLGLMGIERDNYSVSSRILVENRFGPSRVYQCGTCEVRLRYEAAFKGFVVRDLGCGSFPQGFEVSYYSSYNHYSSTSNCPPDDIVDTADGDKEMSSCSVGMSSGDHWEQLDFKDGFEFRFLGNGNQELTCVLK